MGDVVGQGSPGGRHATMQSGAAAPPDEAADQSATRATDMLNKAASEGEIPG